jgi:cell division protein FtsI (penicillin-binding protein 3)
VRAGQRIFCENGAYALPGRTIHDISAHGVLTPSEIMEKSSNIGMVKLVQNLEPDQLRESILRFGFGAKTGIELPGESRGVVAHPDRWSGYTQASWAFGQEILVTVLQMTEAVATVANDGVAVPPRVVLGTRGPDGSFRPADAPHPRRVLSESLARRITEMLEGVVERGTGTRAAVPGYRIAGKSGTAQMVVDGSYSKTDHMVSFGGFGPVEAPRVAALVVLESPRGPHSHGGQVAAPVFGRIMNEALRHLRAPSERDPAPFELQAQAQAAASPAFRLPTASRPGLVPDLAGLSLREALATLSAHGYQAEVRGTGIVTSQHPIAGQPLGPGGTCAVVLEELRPSRLAAGESERAGGAG